MSLLSYVVFRTELHHTVSTPPENSRKDTVLRTIYILVSSQRVFPSFSESENSQSGHNHRENSREELSNGHVALQRVDRLVQGTINSCEGTFPAKETAGNERCWIGFSAYVPGRWSTITRKRREERQRLSASRGCILQPRSSATVRRRPVNLPLRKTVSTIPRVLFIRRSTLPEFHPVLCVLARYVLERNRASTSRTRRSVRRSRSICRDSEEC